MPELPEVQTTVTGLNTVLPGQKFTDIWNDMWSTHSISRNTIKDKKYFLKLRKILIGTKIKNVERRAKYILIHLNSGFTLVIHMKMTGHLMYGKYRFQPKEKAVWKWKPVDTKLPLNDPYNRHIRTVFTLSSGNHLVFSDTRKFGSIYIEKTDTLLLNRLKHLGPEPLDKNFRLNLFKKRLLKSNRPIKTVLMDQTVLSGIGNIYSDEMLHLANIYPKRKTSSLTDKEWQNLFKAMKLVLNKGINLGGDSISDYRNINGAKGKFQEKHRVYLRKNLLCLKKNCGGKIHREVISGRSSHYCTTCQK